VAGFGGLREDFRDVGKMRMQVEREMRQQETKMTKLATR
jgi:hypothetical protein